MNHRDSFKSTTIAAVIVLLMLAVPVSCLVARACLRVFEVWRARPMVNRWIAVPISR